MTSLPTKCKDNCFSCKCGGEEATKDMYVSIHNVQRVCAITGGAADTDEGEYIAEVIRNNLENMVVSVAESPPVKRGKWELKDAVKILYTGRTFDGFCRCHDCKNIFPYHYSTYNYCPNCGADMRGDTDG